MDKLIKRMLITGCLLLAGMAEFVHAGDVQIIIPPNNPALLNLARAAQHALQQLEPAPQVTIDTPATSANTKADSLLVAIGDELTDWTRTPANATRPTLYFYVSAIHYNQLPPRSAQTALFRDQPLIRQLELAALLLPNAQSALVLHRQGQFTANNNIKSSRLAVEYRDVSAESDWMKIMAQWVHQSDVLIGVDDRELYNRDTIRSILLTTYRQGKVLIGPNRGFVNAGSLASTYSSPEHYLQQLQAMVKSWLNSGALPPAQFPRHFQLVVNRQVADSLGLSLADDQILLRQLQQRLQAVEGCDRDC